MTTLPLGRLEEMAQRLAELEAALVDPIIAADPPKLTALSREHAQLEPLVAQFRQWQSLGAQMADLEELIASESGEMVELAEFELGELSQKRRALASDLIRSMRPRHPFADRPAILEIRAGTGGDEASLFAVDLLKMYVRDAQVHGLKVEELEMAPTEVGGLREAVIQIQGSGSFERYQFESGVHRVQRVPETENQGRIHTSACTVAVLPEPEEVEVELNPNELRIDVYRSSGPGGQSVNTTDSAVRITHVPTGVVVICQDEKSQHKNKAKAMKILRARLFDRAAEQAHSSRAEMRRLQVGSGDRSERIRTYNFPQNRVTDHRINVTIYRLDEVISGLLDPLIEPLLDAQEALAEGSRS